MPNYLVRLKDGGEAVGIFAVKDLAELRFWVDEVTDPGACEYTAIGSGSIVWLDGGAERVPLSDRDWESEDRSVLEIVGPASLGEAWTTALTNDDLQFLPLSRR